MATLDATLDNLREVYTRCYSVSKEAAVQGVIQYCASLARRSEQINKDFFENFRAVLRGTPTAGIVPDQAPAVNTQAGDRSYALENKDLLDLLSLLLGNEAMPASDSSDGVTAAIKTALVACNDIMAKSKSRTAAVKGVIGLQNELMTKIINYEIKEEEAVKESFDRMLNALDPLQLAEKTDKKRFNIKMSYKSSLYDELCKKHEQLKAYHESGRLVRDHKSSLRRLIKLSQ